MCSRGCPSTLIVETQVACATALGGAMCHRSPVNLIMVESVVLVGLTLLWFADGNCDFC